MRDMRQTIDETFKTEQEFNDFIDFYKFIQDFDSNLRSLKSFIRGLWSWKDLNECFNGTKIRVTDIDGLVERKGNFLLLEGKTGDKELDIGQQITIDKLHDTGLFTIICVYGIPPRMPQRLKIYYPGVKKPKDLFNANMETLQDLVSRWYTWADASKPISLKQNSSDDVTRYLNKNSTALPTRKPL